MNQARKSGRLGRLSPAALAMGLVLVGCSGEMNPPMPDPGGGGMVSFADQIQPILTTACAGCHSPGGLADLRGIALQLTADRSYDLLVGQPSVQQADLTLVVPGDPDASLLLAKVSSASPPVGEMMPLFAPPLSAAEIGLIREWIAQDAMEN